MKGINFLRITDLKRAEIERVLELSIKLKEMQKKGRPHPILQGKVLAMIFEKPSSRTRISFEVGMFQLGGSAINVNAAEIKMGDRESVPDVARTLSRYVDVVMIRALHHWTLEEFGSSASVPLVNGLSDHHHPCQALADILTVMEQKKDLSKVKIAYIGDGNNVCNSLIEICRALNISLTVATPLGYEPLLAETSQNIQLTHNPIEAAENSDVLYTDVWVSMGQEDDTSRKLSAFHGYMIDNKMFKAAKKDAVFMHCLPAHRGLEVDKNVFESSRSIVFDQAENRLHCQKAVLSLLLAEDEIIKKAIS